MGNIILTGQVIFRNIQEYIYIYTYTALVKKKRGHKFVREQGEIYGRVWRDKTEWGSESLYYTLKIKRNNRTLFRKQNAETAKSIHQ